MCILLLLLLPPIAATISTTATITTTTTTTKAKGTKVKIMGNIEGELELNQIHYIH